MANAVDLGIPGIGPATLLDRGGSATVYLAEQEDFGRKVAVKVLFDALEDDATYKRFDRECRAIGAVSNHPNIVVVHGRGLTADDRPYLVMEHRADGSLADQLAVRGRFTEAEAIRIGIKIGSALDVAHAAGVLHRDVKPANILLSSYNEPALADFGIARIEGGHKTTEGVFSASVVHAGREILDTGEPTPQSDLYALASTLFELVTGHPAFANPDDVSMWAIISRVLTEDPPDPTLFGVGDGLAAVLAKSMSHDQAKRHRSASDFVRDLKRLQSGGGAAAETKQVEAITNTTPVDLSSGLSPGPAADAAAGRRGPEGSGSDSQWISRAGVLLSAGVMVAVTATAGGLAYLNVNSDRNDDATNPPVETPTESAGRSEDVAVSDTVPAEGDGSASDRNQQVPAVAILSVSLDFEQATIGPLRAGDRYVLRVVGGPEDAEYRIVVDNRPVTDRTPEKVPIFFPDRGRHQVRVEVTTDNRVELTNEAEIYVSDRSLEPGYRANLASIRSRPENWPEALRQFDQLVADGHERLELSLSTRDEPNNLPYWNYYVDGFGEDREAAQAYCDGFGLDNESCFVAMV